MIKIFNILMSSNNNDDKTDKISLNKETNTASLNEDLLEKQNIKTKKNKQNTNKNESQKQKEQDKDSIFSGSSNDNENNNNNDENDNDNDNDNNNSSFENNTNTQEQNTNNNINNSLQKETLDVNKSSSNTQNADNNNSSNNFFDNNNNIKNEEILNISRSMSSKSNNSRSRSRSQSEKNSANNSPNKIFEGQNQEKNMKISGNKFKNFKNRRQRNQNMMYNQGNNNSTFIMKNGCCRNCMKAFSKNGKSCLCQVPRKERKFYLPESGCNYCGCHGCNPIDMKYNERLQQKNILFSDKSINHKNQRILDSDDEDLKINDNLVDYYNKDKKEIADNLSEMLKVNSIFYGFGVPLRIPSYILGYNPNVNYYYEKKKY